MTEDDLLELFLRLEKVLKTLLDSLETLEHTLQGCRGLHPLAGNRSSDGPATSVHHTDLKDPLPNSNRPRVERLSDRAIDLIKAHYALTEENKDRCADSLTLSAAAAALQVGPEQLSKTFRREQNESFKSYLMRYRFDQSCGLLRQGRSVKNAALSLGFKDLSYYSREFRERFNNLTPSEYKETHRCDALHRIWETTLGGTPAPVS